MKNLTYKYDVDYSKRLPGFELLNEDNFISEMFEKAHPFMKQYKKDGYAEITDDIKIHYETYLLPKDTSKGTIFMLHGFTGFTGKFYEVIYYFLKQNYSVVALDFRGHGYSYRELDDGHYAKTYIKDFETFISDTLTVYELAVRPSSDGKPVFLYSHSMGGCVATRLVELHPELFAGAILGCPMMGMKTGGIPRWLTKLICRIMIAKNGGTDYIIGAHDFDYKGEFVFKCGPTVSFNRYAYYNELRKVDTHYFSKFATYKFIFEALKGGKKSCNKKLIKNANIPVLIMQAENDTYVYNNLHDRFAKFAPNAKICVMKDCEHELFSSRNEYLYAYYYEIFNFLENISR